jgi:hypothetical protein
MKKSLILTALITAANFAFSQVTITAPFTAKLTNSQKYGLDIIEGEFVLTVIYDDENLKFNTSEGQTMESYSVAKKTEKYIIVESGGNYAFFNIKKKQFYYIDYFMSRYTTAGYGPGYPEVKQNVVKMMDILNEGSTQKDVIQHLVKQTEYDF